MQQRRGTAAQWTAANPILAAGEIGFETDTSKFKMGNGSSTWSALQYFANAAELAAIVDGAPGLLNTLNELAASIGDDPAFFTTVADNLEAHRTSTGVHGVADMTLLATTAQVATAVNDGITGFNAITTSVHGIANTANLALTADVADDIAAAITAHGLVTQNIHGIGDTADLALTEDVANDISGAITAHGAVTQNIHGINDTSLLATTEEVDSAIAAAIANLATNDALETAIESSTVDQSLLAGTGIDWNSSSEQFDIDSTVATKTYADGSVTTHNSLTTNVHGIADTSVLATATTVATAKSEAITAAGTAADTKVSTAVAALTKSSVGLANVDNTADSAKPVSTAQATAIATAKSEAIADATSQVNALITGAPAALNTLDELAAALGDDANFASTVTTSLGLKAPLASPTFTGTVTVAASGIAFTDGTQTMEGVPSRTPIIQKTASYTLSSLTERDDLIEMGSASAMTLTIPADSTVNFPIGTSIDILQTGAGQVTIAGTGFTPNATPGLKLRTQWSSCTLFKRAANTWVVYGDLTA